MEEVKEGYLKQYGRIMSDEEVEDMFRAVDTDNSGFIDYSEFVAAATNQSTLMSKENLMMAFRMFDKDKTGTINAEDIRKVLGKGNEKQLSTEVVDDIIKQVDEDGDGKISFDEFVNMMLAFDPRVDQ